MNWQEKAEELFGTHWKATVAVLMGCTKRYVQYWVSGDRPTPYRVHELINATYAIWRKHD